MRTPSFLRVRARVRRRSVLIALLAALNIRGSHAARQYQIGVLGVSDWDPSDPLVLPLVNELARLGYVRGRNLHFVVRVCGADLQRLDALAAELVKLRVDVILSDGGTPSALAAKRATSTIPIVLGGARDPVADGLVSSLAKPGGNVTGNADMGPQLMVKRLQLLIEAVGARGPGGYVAYQPHLGRESERRTIVALDELAKSQGVRLIVAPVGGSLDQQRSDLESAFASLNRQGVVAAVVNNYSTIGVDRAEDVAALMIHYRIPSIMEYRGYALGGVLMTYTEPNEDMAIRSARFIDRLLKGATPADLPLEQGTRFELVINLRTADAMNIVIPKAILLRADELIR